MASLTEAVASLNSEKGKILEDARRFAQENHVRGATGRSALWSFLLRSPPPPMFWLQIATVTHFGVLCCCCRPPSYVCDLCRC